MAYTMEDIRKSQEIFYYLLEKHELREEDEQALYKAYTEEEDIQNIVNRKLRPHPVILSVMVTRFI